MPRAWTPDQPTKSRNGMPKNLPATIVTPPRSSSLRPHPHRISSSSQATSNSSVPPSPTHQTPNTSQSALESEEHTAALIKSLYDRLEEQGVPGDGWDEGRERSRDGIICREEALGIETVKLQRNGVAKKQGHEDGGEKQDSILKRVDRYGFFSNSHPAAIASQHNRISALTASPYQQLSSSKKKPGSSAPTPTTVSRKQQLAHRTSVVSLASPVELELETKRISKWGEMLKVSSRDRGGNIVEWDVDSSWWSGRKDGGGKYRKFQRRVFKGVPDRWRRAVWGLELEKVANEMCAGRSLDELKREYQRLITSASSQDIQIDLDVPRTISGHVLFHTRYGHGQRALFHVLHAFGLHCSDIGGYCQGMGPIAATLLCYFEPERAYGCLVRLFDQYNLKEIFAPGFPGLLEAFYIQERLVELLMPEVHESFQAQMISTSAYATKWYITLFANSIPFSTQLRFWDGLLLEGIDFLIIASVAIIWCYRDQFAPPKATFESILSTLSSYFIVEDDDALMRWIRKTLRRKDLRKKMAAWREEWKGFVREGTASRLVT
ncbi:GTPase activating protein [Pseudohyphozyma bogoriensis]|nr:GTPase activating protein [Pseudohyphozyma bogoriensis]